VTAVLVDTSAWRRFFAGAKAFRGLAALLDDEGAVITHPFVLGELVLGGLGPGEQAVFERLPAAPEVAHAEVLAFVRHHDLARRGIGWVDAHLLASAAVGGARVWTADRPLAAAATRLGLGWTG
jgi:predicted nucleic acid-binding protein